MSNSKKKSAPKSKAVPKAKAAPEAKAAPKKEKILTKRERIEIQRKATYDKCVDLRDHLRGCFRDGNQSALLAAVASFIIYYQGNNIRKK